MHQNHRDSKTGKKINLLLSFDLLLSLTLAPSSNINQLKFTRESMGVLSFDEHAQKMPTLTRFQQV